MKSINGHHRLNELERLRAALLHRPDITIIDAYLEPDHKIALTASCDCYVSLHRSEGFGFTMAEAMALGKPVIATAYGGNLDFMTDENSYLVPYKFVPVGPDAVPTRAPRYGRSRISMRLPG